jgi:hypothetical protein
MTSELQRLRRRSEPSTTDSGVPYFGRCRRDGENDIYGAWYSEDYVKELLAKVERLRGLLRRIRDCSVSPYAWTPDMRRQVDEAIGDE